MWIFNFAYFFYRFFYLIVIFSTCLIRSSFLLRYREYLNLPRVSQYLKKPISQLALLISQLALKFPISQKANISTCLANISTCLKSISQANISNWTNISCQYLKPNQYLKARQYLKAKIWAQAISQILFAISHQKQ